MDWIYKYYGIDWMVFALIVAHLWLLGSKRRCAFLIGAVACCFGFAFGFLVESVASMIMNSVFCLMHIRVYYKWGQKEVEIFEGFQPKIAEDTWPEDHVDFSKRKGDHRA